MFEYKSRGEVLVWIIYCLELLSISYLTVLGAVSFLFYSFGLRHWFKFGVPVVSSPPSFDSSTEVSMVEGMLTLLITLLSTRLHLGNLWCHVHIVSFLIIYSYHP